MQLVKWSCASAVAVTLVLVLGRASRAQVAELDTSHTVFYEAPTRTNMFVYTPSVDVQATPWSWLEVRAGWEADVVSGASVATKFGSVYHASHPADFITAASVHDVRNMGGGEVTVKGDANSLTAGYDYSTEHDYRSHSLHVNARTDAFQHNTQFALSYGRNFDQVCDRVQTEIDDTRKSALETSTGCFTADSTRTTHSIGIDTFEGSWAQSWTPIVETQLTYTAQLVDGFQSDPYRSVVLGEAVKAQEHVPNERARQAVTARLAVYLRGLKAALRLSLRGYSDTWALQSGTVEAELEKSLGDSLRVMLRGRVYKQSGAVFWSDDYTGGDPPLGPRGQYWTADRELSPFWSWLVGARLVWTDEPERGRILGLFEKLKLVGSVSMTSFSYDEYTLGGTPVSDARAYVATISLVAGF